MESAKPVRRPPLLCHYCGERIKRSPAAVDDGYDETFFVSSGIERAYHFRCHPDAIPPDSPLDAAILQAKQAVAHARRLGPEEFQRFGAAVLLLLAEPKTL